ncbi:helix-turn-helix transcriptional regulator [Acidisoma cellulosilytica]|uniref:Helix-turn-helix transcriptional regulator n=1 Tax=Acidisoma cellulosilyticum TaxID=2802395 RepID=A0A963Z4W1_9PROT|nr:helix-turn-helix domain-containing protein [Acidisoma cellulosilyticum]MCB8882684.1 helix-turn-helix transcriptional regulator [Acidisoma cellulosilyticum]
MHGSSGHKPRGAEDSIGRLLGTLRHQSGLTQKDFAAALGVGRSLVARWETDRGGETAYLPRIAELLGVSPEVFLNRMVSQTTTETVTIDEAELIQIYRTLSISDRVTALRHFRELRDRAGS